MATGLVYNGSLCFDTNFYDKIFPTTMYITETCFLRVETS